MFEIDTSIKLFHFFRTKFTHGRSTATESGLFTRRDALNNVPDNISPHVRTFTLVDVFVLIENTTILRGNKSIFYLAYIKVKLKNEFVWSWKKRLKLSRYNEEEVLLTRLYFIKLHKIFFMWTALGALNRLFKHFPCNSKQDTERSSWDIIKKKQSEISNCYLSSFSAVALLKRWLVLYSFRKCVTWLQKHVDQQQPIFAAPSQSFRSDEATSPCIFVQIG